MQFRLHGRIIEPMSIGHGQWFVLVFSPPRVNFLMIQPSIDYIAMKEHTRTQAKQMWLPFQVRVLKG
jgi:hypothetical protein